MPRQIDCFCAFCRTPRKVYSTRKMGLHHFLSALILSFAFSYVAWGEVDARVFPWMILFVILFEVLIQYRWRMAVNCPHCGFDPILYIKSPKKACDKVKVHLEGRKRNPISFLAAKPLINIPMRMIKNNSSGASVSSGERGKQLSLNRLNSVVKDNSLKDSKDNYLRDSKDNILSKSKDSNLKDSFGRNTLSVSAQKPGVEALRETR